MGMNKSIYVGPYLKAKNNLVKAPKSLHTCDTPKCKRHMTEISTQEEHCWACGQKLVTKQVDNTKERISDWDVSEKIQEKLSSFMRESSPDRLSHYWVPNIVKTAPRKMNIYFDDAIEQSNIDSDKEKEWFKQNFKQEIETLESIYGKENLTLHWGVLGTYS